MKIRFREIQESIKKRQEKSRLSKNPSMLLATDLCVLLFIPLLLEFFSFLVSTAASSLLICVRVFNSRILSSLMRASFFSLMSIFISKLRSFTPWAVCNLGLLYISFIPDPIAILVYLDHVIAFIIFLFLFIYLLVLIF